MLLRRCLLTSFFFIVAGPLTLANPDAKLDSADPWRVRLETTATGEAEVQPGSIVLQRASYTVNVVGANAIGTVVQKFLNAGEIDVLATYIGHVPSGLVPHSLELDVDNVIVEHATAPSAPKPAPDRKTRGRSRTESPEPMDLQLQLTKPFSMPAGSKVTVRSAFSVELSLHEGLFRLRVPPVRYEITPFDVAQAVLGDILVTVLHDEPLPRIESATHNILSGFDAGRTWVELADRNQEIRPFEMTFALGRKDQPSLVGYAGPERDGAREVTVVFSPAVEPAKTAIRPKQLFFILDTSGSMANDKLKNAKVALASCLDKLGPADQLNLAEFDSGFTLFRSEPVQAQQHLDAAQDWLASQKANGGTRLMPALEAILEQPVSPEHHRMIVVLSDGNLADEKQALDLLEEKLGDARLFVVGIGKDVRQNTVLRLSEYGRGTAVFVDRPEELETAVSGLFDSVSQPLAWDLELDWGGAEVETIGTDRIPDLYAARPVTVQARIRGQLPAEVLLHVTTTEGTKTFVTVLPDLTLR